MTYGIKYQAQVGERIKDTPYLRQRRKRYVQLRAIAYHTGTPWQKFKRDLRQWLSADIKL